MASALTETLPDVLSPFQYRSTKWLGTSAAGRLLTQPVAAELQLRESILSVELPRPEPKWWCAALTQLQNLSALGPDWDSYGGVPPADDVLVVALTLISALLATDSAAPSIIPTSDGGVQLEWEGDADELEIRIRPGGGITGFRVDGALETEFEFESVSLAEMERIIAFSRTAQ